MAACALALASAAQAQGAAAPAAGPSIYSCVDAQGRTLTADRPIPECMDRPQRELTPSGSTRRVLEPSATPQEQAEREARARQARAQAARAQEERRRERALLIRYPTSEAHARGRAEAIGQIDAVIEAARKRLSELAQERRGIDDELEFYRSDPSRTPASLRRHLEDNEQSVAAQNRFIEAQEDEKRRVNARFDEEAARLRAFWLPKDAAVDRH